MSGEPSVAVNRDGGGIDMHTGPTRDIAKALATDADAYQRDWDRLRRTMEAIEATIGNPALGDTLSSTFRNAYNPAVEQLTKDYNDAAAELRQDAKNGHAAVDEYLGTDAAAGRTQRAASDRV